jgi:hypothetical protein
MSSRESELLQWLYALSIDESLSDEQVRENARGALAEYLGEPRDRPAQDESEADA